MAINFFEAQKKLRSKTWLYLFLFFLLAFGVAILIEFIVGRITVHEEGVKPAPYLGLLFLGITFLVAAIYYLSYRSFGGKMVAQSLGGREASPLTNNFKEKQFINVAHEMAIASGQPVPDLYIIEAKEINAFAAGLRPDNAAITVTRGALEYLDRDELQGVIAHEFGHIYNGDMKISMRLSAMIMGFMIVFYLGTRLLQGSMIFGGGSSNRKGNPVMLVALAFVFAGVITWFAGALLRASVSRQREYLADACATAGIPLIHFSTDYVFDGRKPTAYTEDDRPAPINVYGAGKFAGEEAVRRRCARHVILRTSWLYGAHGGNFVKTVLRLARERDSLRIVDDQRGCPTLAGDLAEAALAIAARLQAASAAELFGTFHCAGSGATTWFRFARRIVELASPAIGRKPAVEAIATADYPAPARRPANSALDCRRLADIYGLSLRSWEAALPEMLGAALAVESRAENA